MERDWETVLGWKLVGPHVGVAWRKEVGVCEGGVGWNDACLFLGAALVVAFWGGRDVGSAGAPGVGGDGLSAGDGDGVSGR